MANKSEKKITADNYEKVINLEGADFSEVQLKNISAIVKNILPKLSGLYGSCSTGGGFEHIFLQLKDGKWLGFHNVTGDVTVSDKAYKTFNSLYDVFSEDMESEQTVTGTYIKYFTGKKGESEDDFRAIDAISKDILEENYAKVDLNPQDELGPSDDYWYIDYLDKDNKHKEARKKFKSEDAAIEWGKANLDNYNSDMVRFELKDMGANKYRSLGDLAAQIPESAWNLGDSGCWELIKKANWEKDHDFKRISVIYQALSKKDFDRLKQFFDERMQELDVKFKEAWLKPKGKGINVSDDGWNDLRAEVIGRGKKFYDKITVAKLKKLVADEDFHENFGYSFQKHTDRKETGGRPDKVEKLEISSKSIERFYALGILPPDFDVRVIDMDFKQTFPNHTIREISDVNGDVQWYDAQDKAGNIVAFSKKIEKVIGFIRTDLAGASGELDDKVRETLKKYELLKANSKDKPLQNIEVQKELQPYLIATLKAQKDGLVTHVSVNDKNSFSFIYPGDENCKVEITYDPSSGVAMTQDYQDNNPPQTDDISLGSFLGYLIPKSKGGPIAPVGKYLVELSSAGNIDFRQDPNSSLSPSRSVVVATPAQASKKVREYIEEHDLGGGNWTGGAIYNEKGQQIAHVSYNGRVWEGKASDWNSNTKEIGENFTDTLPEKKEKGGGIALSRYKPDQINGEWQIKDTDSKKIVAAKFIDAGLPKPPYAKESEAESVAFAMNQALAGEMQNWGKDGGKPNDFGNEQLDRDKQYAKDSKNFKKFIEGLENLTLKHGFVLHVTGGVRYVPNVGVQGIVYSNDLSSGDIIPAIVKWSNGEVENNTRMEHGGKIKRSDFQLGEAIRLIKIAEDGKPEKAIKELQDYLDLYIAEKQQGNIEDRLGRSLDSLIEEYKNAVAYVHEIPKKHNCDNALTKMLADLDKTTITFVSSKEKRGVENQYAQRLLGKINALRTYIKEINPNEDLSAYDFIDQF